MFLLFVNALNSQGNNYYSVVDTIKIESRTGGNELDSVPEYHSGVLVLNPGSYSNGLYGNFGNEYENVLNKLGSSQNLLSKQNFIFTAAPHLGFMYSFGSGGIQQLHFEYQQFFSKKFGINLNLNRNSMGEMMREGNFAFSEFQMKTRFVDKRYKNYTLLAFQKFDMNHNGGLDTSASVLEFPLNFLGVNKSSSNLTKANDSAKQFRLETEHYFNFLNDSIKGLGLLLHQKWDIYNRIYKESGDLDSVYSIINIDSSETRDQFQFARIDNNLGVYTSGTKFFATASFSHAYWAYQNLGLRRDTVELGFNANLSYKFKSFSLNNQSYYNLAGAKGEKSTILNLNLDQTKFRVHGSFSFSQKLTELFQRSYFANNISWKTTSLSTQNLMRLAGNIELKGKYELKAHVSYSNFSNYYFLLDSVWRNDTLSSLNLLNANIRASFKYKALFFQPTVILNQFSKDLSFLPKLDFRARLGIHKKVFKSQKLDFIAAVDFSYLSSRKLLTYSNSLDLFVLNNGTQSTNANLYKLDFFTGIQVETFRFYVKVENINYLWDRSDSYVFENIPITPFHLRIGLTWDFFN